MMMLLLNILFHYFLTSTQNTDISLLSSYFTNDHHHPSSLCSSGPHRHVCQNWSSLSSLLVVTSQLLPTGLLAVNIVTELVFLLCRPRLQHRPRTGLSAMPPQLRLPTFSLDWSPITSCFELKSNLS